MVNLHPSEYQNHWLSGFRSHGISIGCLVLSAALTIGGAVTKEHDERTGMLSLAGLALLCSRAAVSNQVEKERIVYDFSDISDASRQQRLYEAMQPTAQVEAVEHTTPTEPFEPELFNWLDLATKGNKHPHIMILGQTGDGKTTLAEWLHQQIEGEHVALHPHWQAGDPGERTDFEYCDQVIGGGRRFKEISDYVSKLHEEMDRRSKLGKADLRSQPQISVLVDELPAIAKNCGEATIEQLVSLIFEARKFKIRLIVLAQADSVKILKIEGQGAVRENLTYVRLGDFARTHAKQLISKKRADQRLVDWVDSYDRPSMIEDSPAIVPIIINGQAHMPGSVPPDGGPQGGKKSFTLGQGVKNSFTPLSSGESQAGQLIRFPGTQGGKNLPPVNIALLEAIYGAMEGGKISSSFITDQLGLKGKHYSGAKQLLDQLFLTESDKNSA